MAGIPLGFCHSCINCKGQNDWHQYCPNTGGLIGVTAQGCFAEYIVADAETSCHIPDKVSFASAAPLACAGITIYRAVIVAGVKKGGWLAIVGAGGGLGHLGIQFAKAKESTSSRLMRGMSWLALCKQAGAEHVFDAREGKEKVVEQILTYLTQVTTASKSVGGATGVGGSAGRSRCGADCHSRRSY